MTTRLASHTANRGLKIEEIRSEYEGDIGLRRLLDIDRNVAPGYRQSTN